MLDNCCATCHRYYYSTHEWYYIGTSASPTLQLCEHVSSWFPPCINSLSKAIPRVISLYSYSWPYQFDVLFHEYSDSLFVITESRIMDSERVPDDQHWSVWSPMPVIDHVDKSAPPANQEKEEKKEDSYITIQKATILLYIYVLHLVLVNSIISIKSTCACKSVTCSPVMTGWNVCITPVSTDCHSLPPETLNHLEMHPMLMSYHLVSQHITWKFSRFIIWVLQPIPNLGESPGASQCLHRPRHI